MKLRAGVKGGIVLILSCTLSSSAIVQDLAYRNRNDRYEGIRPNPVSGYDIELISALVNYKDAPQARPETARIRFYLGETRDVHLTVRELDYRTYYWMDQVRPPRPWRTGFDNVFAWPTDVINAIEGLDLYDLGVVVRLDRDVPGILEEVAPAFLYYSELPKRINEYLFTLKTNGRARLLATIRREKDGAVVQTVPFPNQQGGRPFVVRWETREFESGFYSLQITGFFLNNNRRINQTVRFFHQPTFN